MAESKRHHIRSGTMERIAQRREQAEEQKVQQIAQIANAMERLTKYLEDQLNQSAKANEVISIPNPGFHDIAYCCIILAGGETLVDIKYATMPTIQDLIDTSLRKPGIGTATIYITEFKA